MVHMLGQNCNAHQESFTFQKGERLSTFSIATNGNDNSGARVNWISFTTELGNSFSAGNGFATHRSIQVSQSYLTGFWGYEGADIDSLGVILTKPVSYSTLNNLLYPTLATITTGLQPKVLNSEVFCNSSPLQSNRDVQSSVTSGSTNCWTVEGSLGYEMTASVEAGIPEVAKVGQTTKWTVGVTASWNQCTQSTTESQETNSFPVPAESQCQVTITQYASTLNTLPWSGSLILNFLDGTNATLTVSGLYSGVYVQNEQISNTCTVLAAGNVCLDGVVHQPAGNNLFRPLK